MDYKEKLKHPKWQKMRLQVLERDGWKCQCCPNTEVTLHVHHFSYEYGRDPWDYPMDNLITLCANCHDLEEDLRKVDFFRIPSERSKIPAIKLWVFASAFAFSKDHNPEVHNKFRDAFNDYIMRDDETRKKFGEFLSLS